MPREITDKDVKRVASIVRHVPYAGPQLREKLVRACGVPVEALEAFYVRERTEAATLRLEAFRARIGDVSKAAFTKAYKRELRSDPDLALAMDEEQGR